MERGCFRGVHQLDKTPKCVLLLIPEILISPETVSHQVEKWLHMSWQNFFSHYIVRSTEYVNRGTEAVVAVETAGWECSASEMDYRVGFENDCLEKQVGAP